MVKRGLTCGLAVLVTSSAFAQGAPVAGQPQGGRPVIERQPNTTGNSRDAVIAPGRTGASTVTTDSAAGGNASHPERPVPNGSAGGGSGSR